MISRRDFLTNCARLAPIIGGAGILLSDPLWQGFLSGGDFGVALAGNSIDELVRSAPRARYWTSLHKDNHVRCFLCPHGCIIGDGERGKCRTRVNVKGGLRSLVYGRPVSIHVDPIEKKPFYHFLPGAEAYSLATAGCPLQCKCCQNWEISQARPEDYQSPLYFTGEDRQICICQQGTRHSIYLQRASDLCRIHDRYRPRCEETRPPFRNDKLRIRK